MNTDFYGKINVKSMNVKYGKDIDDIFNFISEDQLKDRKLWKTLVLQFIIKSDDKDYGWRGEYWGKLMRGASLICSYTKDKALYDILSETVEDIIAASDEKGLIRSYGDQKELHGWDLWSRKYVMLGLQFFLDICRDENQKKKIIDVIKIQADYVIENVNENKLPINKTSGIWGAANSYSILQPIVRLYKLTGDKKYLDYARYLVEDQDVCGMNLFDVAYQNKMAPFDYSVNKAYEVMSCFEGVLEYYEVTGEKKYLISAINFANGILDTDFTIVGGSGCKSEQFDNSTRRQTIPSPSEMQETCVTVTLIKFLSELFKFDKNVRYADAVERAFYNLYRGAINYNHKENKYPLFLSYSPILNAPRWKFIGGRKGISPVGIFGCCISIGAAGLGMVSKESAFIEDKTVYLNMLADADYFCDTKEGKIEISVCGGYPEKDKICIKIGKTPKNGIKLKIRKPDWCKNYRINGDFELDGGYLVKDNVTAGAEFCYELDMPLCYTFSEEVNPCVDYRVALSLGPIVLCQDMFEEDVPVDFDFNQKSVDKRVDEYGKTVYDLKLKNDKILTLCKYSDGAKKNINLDSLNVWFRKK